MIMRNLILLFIILSFTKCSFKNDNQIIFDEVKKIGLDYKLSKCEVEVKKYNNTEVNKKNEIILSFQNSTETDSIYTLKPYYLLGIISYKLYEKLEAKKLLEDYSIVNVSNTKLNKKSTFLIDDLKQTKKAISKVNNFFIQTDRSQDVRLIQDIDKNYIDIKKLQLIVTGLETLSKYGAIKRKEVLGIDYNKISSTGEKVIIISCFIERDKSEDIITFYLKSQSLKIIQIELLSNSSPTSL
jgi:hypothetical protein